METTQNVALPNRTLLRAGIWLGTVLILCGIALFAYHAWKDYLSFPEAYYSYKVNDWITPSTGIHWYHWVAVLVSGVAILWYANGVHRYYYRTVFSGKVVRRGTIGGGGYMPLEWRLCIEGQTLAGETYTNWITVNAGFWHDTKIGDSYDE